MPNYNVTGVEIRQRTFNKKKFKHFEKFFKICPHTLYAVPPQLINYSYILVFCPFYGISNYPFFTNIFSTCKLRKTVAFYSICLAKELVNQDAASIQTNLKKNESWNFYIELVFDLALYPLWDQLNIHFLKNLTGWFFSAGKLGKEKFKAINWWVFWMLRD